MIEPSPTASTISTTMSPKPPPWRDSIAPTRITAHPTIPIIRAVSLTVPSTNVSVVVTVVVVTTLDAPLDNNPDFSLSGLTTLSSASSALFALSSNPAIVPVSKHWSYDLSYELSACRRHKSPFLLIYAMRQIPGADSRHCCSPSSSSSDKYLRPATAAARATIESAGISSKPGR